MQQPCGGPQWKVPVPHRGSPASAHYDLLGGAEENLPLPFGLFLQFHELRATKYPGGLLGRCYFTSDLNSRPPTTKATGLSVPILLIPRVYEAGHTTREIFWQNPDPGCGFGYIGGQFLLDPCNHQI